MSDGRILLIEDDTDAQEVMSRILLHYDIDIDVVSTAEDALPLLENRDYTAAVVDLALPGIDGWQLLNAIRHSPRTAELPCLAITAYHSVELAVKAIQEGFTAYLPKPIESISFINELQRII
jgi:CheY-like chemotaxis protein